MADQRANDRTLLISGYGMFTGAGPGLSGVNSRRFGCWGLFGECDGDGFEFGDELAQPAVSGEVGA
jgi:hypothetical protein